MHLERKTKAKSFKTSGLLCVFTLCLQQTWNWIICKKGMVEWCRMLSVVLMDLSKDFEHALSAVQRNPTQPNQHDINGGRINYRLSSHVILLGPGQMLHPSLVIQQYLRVDQHPQHRHLMSFSHQMGGFFSGKRKCSILSRWLLTPANWGVVHRRITRLKSGKSAKKPSTSMTFLVQNMFFLQKNILAPIPQLCQNRASTSLTGPLIPPPPTPAFFFGSMWQRAQKTRKRWQLCVAQWRSGVFFKHLWLPHPRCG